MTENIKPVRKSRVHQNGLLTPTLLKRAVVIGRAPRVLSPQPGMGRQLQKIDLAMYCVTVAQGEFGDEIITANALLEWIFSLIEDDIYEEHWVRIASAMYCLSLCMVGAYPKDPELRRFCDQMYKPRAEYHSCLRFVREQKVRERLGIKRRALFEALAFEPDGISEHMKRVTAV